jgi:predicted nucleic acid-binding Zn ribbon protein
MPIYEYEPTLFSEEENVNECCFFETLQSVTEPKLEKCPTCGHKIHRCVTSFSTVVSGSNAVSSSSHVSGTAAQKQTLGASQNVNQGRLNETFAEKFGALLSAEEKQVLSGRKSVEQFQKEQNEEAIFQASQSSQSSNPEKAKKAAKMLARHICSSGCKH